MKTMMLRFSRRERLALIAGGTILLLGVGVYPAMKAASAYRREQLEMLSDERALLNDLNRLVGDAAGAKAEYEQLRARLHDASDWLFEGHENPIMTQAMMIKLLNELGPDLEIEVTPGRSSIGAARGATHLIVRGKGRYPQILNFLYRVETHLPLIMINELALNSPRRERPPSPAGAGRAKGKTVNPEKTRDPGLLFKLSIEINTRDSEGAA